VVASIDRIGRELGWSPRYDLTDVVRSQWQARTVRRDPDRVVVVSASVGAGHDGAARELADRLRHRGIPVTVVDLLSVFPAGTGWLVRDAYRAMIERQPWIYDRLFHIACRFRGAAPVTRALLRPVRRRLLAVLPADTGAVVSTYPLGAQVLGPLRQRGQLRVPVATYLTDFAVHPLWVAPGVDLHCAAHVISRVQAARLGAAGVRVCGRLVGIPARRPAGDRDRLRSRLGLPARERLALLVAGSWGVGEVVAAALEVAATRVATPVVVCGRNTGLRRRLAALGLRHVYGWVDAMPDLMSSVDVLVENAGGLTSLEAMACGVPVLSYRPIPGHGVANAAAMARAGVTCWVRHRDRLGPALRELLDGARGQRQRERALALFASDPAGLLADLVTPPRAGSRHDRAGAVAA
jgi:UDP-N-acetylglucosamine:LPS N-acetylglucosamine transferase